MNVSQGTLIWKWTDDNGELHRFEIPNSYYVPEGKVRLLSPQHWAQSQKDEKPIQGTGETTDAKNVTLFWNQRQNKLTVPINRKDNVATFKLASRYTKFHTFCAKCEVDMDHKHNDPLIADPTLISNNEVDNNQPAPSEGQIVHKLKKLTEADLDRLTSTLFSKKGCELIYLKGNRIGS